MKFKSAAEKLNCKLSLFSAVFTFSNFLVAAVAVPRDFVISVKPPADTSLPATLAVAVACMPHPHSHLCFS